jgi:hypothetical protein
MERTGPTVYFGSILQTVAQLLRAAMLGTVESRVNDTSALIHVKTSCQPRGPSDPILVTGFENEFLHAPIQQLADVEFVFRRAGNFMDPSELIELLA